MSESKKDEGSCYDPDERRELDYYDKFEPAPPLPESSAQVSEGRLKKWERCPNCMAILGKSPCIPKPVPENTEPVTEEDLECARWILARVRIGSALLDVPWVAEHIAQHRAEGEKSGRAAGAKEERAAVVEPAELLARRAGLAAKAAEPECNCAYHRPGGVQNYDSCQCPGQFEARGCDEYHAHSRDCVQNDTPCDLCGVKKGTRTRAAWDAEKPR